MELEEDLLNLYQSMNLEEAGSFLCGDCCAECCNFELSGHMPFLTELEWSLILKHLPEEPPPSQLVFCPFLDRETYRCSIYRVRPFRCRLYFCHRYPGAASDFNPYTALLNLYLEEYQRLTLGLEQRSIIDRLNDY